MNEKLSELGKKIRSLREEQELSREAFCEEESKLTVRQLARIEYGESLPSLTSIIYISHRLSIPISYLLDSDLKN